METLKAIASRKSTKNYSSEQIPQDKLDIILSAGCAAPVSSGKYESLHITVIQGYDARKVISNVTMDLLKKTFNLTDENTKGEFDPIYNAPTMVLLSAKPIPMLENIEYANVSCVAENMLLAATDLGIDSVYLWYVAKAVRNDKDALKKLHIPEGFLPVSSVALGYATKEIPRERELEISISTNRL